VTAKPFLVIALLLSFALLITATASIAYTPKVGDHFSFYEVENVGNGTGDYVGYTDQTIVNGTELVTGTIENGVVPVDYSFVWTFSNNTGGTSSGKLSGNFTFSSLTFLYVKGTDNQTGPYVWFCMNNSIPNGGTFYLLNTEMTVMSKDYSYFLPSENENVTAIYAQGSSSFQRNDVYGQFNAAYTWKAYFDPTSGYIIGYHYTEQDTNNTGNGFTYTDNLYINSASYSLTVVPSGGGLDVLLIVAIVIIIVVIVIAVYAVSRRRLPKRSSQQSNVPPSTAPPKGPAIKCPYCGGPVYFGDKDVANCEYCGREIQKPPPDS
jgi:hypothetical protein